MYVRKWPLPLCLYSVVLPSSFCSISNKLAELQIIRLLKWEKIEERGERKRGEGRCQREKGKGEKGEKERGERGETGRVVRIVVRVTWSPVIGSRSA
jgi:hypothetical protein